MPAPDIVLEKSEPHFTEVFHEWSYALSFALLVTFLTQVFGFLFPKLLSFLYNTFSPTIRQRNNAMTSLREQLAKLKEEIKSYHMVDQFAKHAKTQRKINTVEKELGRLNSDQNYSSITSSLLFRVIKFFIVTIIMGMLVAYSPQISPFASDAFYLWLELDWGLPYILVQFISILRFFPCKLFMVIWLALTRFAIGRCVTIFNSKMGLSKPQPSIFSGFPQLDPNGINMLNPTSMMKMREEDLD